jgi:membrane protein DedA with SNARE-associated domain
MDHLIHLLIQYKYLVLFPLAIVEGPILAIIVGFLCSGGYLNPLIALPVIVVGDVIGDSICYAFGKFGTPPLIKSIAIKLGFNNRRINNVKFFFETHPRRIILISKITLGIGVAGIYLAGLTRIPYKKFIGACMLTSFFQYIVYIGTGWLFGNAFVQINYYLNVITSFIIVTVLAIIAFFTFQSILRKI